jgi:Zn-dependent protease
MKSQEKKDLFISWITVSIAFSFVLSPNLLNLVSFALALPISLVGVGTGFVLHELGHRQMAKHYGAHAEYKAWNFGLLLALALPIITLGKFVFAAPGAVYIYGPNITREQNGIISLAGPALNIIIAILAILIAFFVIGTSGGFLYTIAIYTMMINLFLAFFNMIPIPPLDGSKVMAWDVRIWALIFIPLLVYFFFF